MPTKQTKPQKKAKASKSDGEWTNLNVGVLNEIGDKVHDATQDAIDEAMSEHQIVLGELRTQLCELVG